MPGASCPRSPCQLVPLNVLVCAEADAGARLDLIVGAEPGAPVDGHNLGDGIDVERRVADPVPPFRQRDVLDGKLVDPCLLENRTRSTGWKLVHYRTFGTRFLQHDPLNTGCRNRPQLLPCCCRMSNPTRG